MRWSGIALFAFTASLLAGAPARDAAAPRVEAALARLPLRFEANQGQWNPAVRYAAHARQYSVSLTAAGASLSVGGGRRVDIALDGSNRAAEIEALDRAPVETNYFLGSRERWRTGVANYSRIRYRGVYPGIDAVYYGNDSRLEYDFLVRPGADPAAIRLRFQGADRTSVTAQGDLLVEYAGGQMTQKRPYIYQRDPRTGARREIAGGYVRLADGATGLRVGSYDRGRELVIDPLLIYSSYIGGAAEDQVNAIKVNSHGLLYVVGRTKTSDLTATSGTYNSANAALGADDIFIMTLDTTAAGDFAVQYLSYLGGTGEDDASSVDLDAAGNLYITGTTSSTDFPMPGGTPIQSTNPSTTHNAFVVEFNPALAGSAALVYATYLGGALDNYGNGIAVDKAGKIYVIGTTTSTDFPVSDGAYAGVLSGSTDAFLCEIDTTTATPVYSTYLGGEAIDEGIALAVAPNGLVYFAITTDSTEFPLSIAPYHGALQGVEDTVVGVVDTTQFGGNSLVYDTYFGGSDLDEVRKLSFDARGRVLLTGFTFSTDFPVTADAVQPWPGGNGDAFVAVVDPAHPEAFLAYSTYLGGWQGEVAYDIAGDAGGNIYVAGYTLSPNFPVTPDAPQTTWGGGTDLFIAKLHPGIAGPAGLQFSTYLGDAGVRAPTSMALGSDGTVYVGGFSAQGLPSAGDAARAYGGGVSDGFVLALSQLAGQPLGNNRKATPRAPRY